MAPATEGSSPRVRGRLPQGVLDCLHRRLIPACAGQTCVPLLIGCGTRAHPRVCGADVAPAVDGLVEGGLIPACAGQTPQLAALSPPPGAHPRVCGADCRGTNCVRLRAGLIPACAGQTPHPRLALGSPRAHPRVCGADVKTTCSGSTRYGSSPRVRGRPCFRFSALYRHGLIPACAGQTGREPSKCTQPTAHPRVCGADETTHESTHHHLGSSPRVRGRRHATRGAGSSDGLIPACAGQTDGIMLCHWSAPAHPRVCGADNCSHRALICGWGSSPRVRGRRDIEWGKYAPAGLIPACAGQTNC